MHSPAPQPTSAMPEHAGLGALRAVLWDMDGTLVDTEPYWIAAEQQLVAQHGGTWAEDQAHQLVGQALETSAGILQQAGVNLGRTEIIDWLTTRVIAGIREQMPWRPGARELLSDLRAHGVRCALVTMSHGPMAQEVVDNLPAGSMEFLVTGDAVRYGKPHPEAYETAIAKLAQQDPTLGAEHCVAIEDSVPGTTAALAAGITTIAVPHMVELQPAPGQVLWDSLAGRSAADVAALLDGTA